MKVNFEVSAKAARLIGRENIADVDGALSELIKNAYDADASCVYVDFYMPFPDVPSRITADRLMTILSEPDFEAVLKFYQVSGDMLCRRDDLSEEEKQELQYLLFKNNQIIIADNGTGMNLDTVCSAWMQIATSNKEQQITSSKGRIKTGAKGIGRFALDKLSQKSVMYTCASQCRMLRWEVDWEQFSSASLLREVNATIEEQNSSLLDVMREIVTPQSFEKLSSEDWKTGTIFILSPTREAWSHRLFEKVNTNLKSINPLGSVDKFDVIVNNRLLPQYSYHTETVAIADRDYDYKISAEYNGENTLSVAIKRNEFDGHRRSVEFSVGEKSEKFRLEDFWSRKAFSEPPFRKDDYCAGEQKIILQVDKFIGAEDFDKVRAVGPFSAELYFVKSGKSDFAIVKDIPTRHRKELLSRFSGVKLYRDNFKVRPYGDEGSLYDWLELNERANKSPAGVSHKSGPWRVLPYQMIGVVKISRIGNAALYDMANREGLTQNESYFYFVRMLQEAISRFEFDRQYIYREYDKWKKECQNEISSVADRIKEDVRINGNRDATSGTSDGHSRNSDGDGGTSEQGNVFTEQEYREAVASLLTESDSETKAKQTLEILSSAGVILNTFFHEFSAVSTALHTRGSQMRARLDNLLKGEPYVGPQFLDPYRKLEDFDKIDRMLAGWLKVVMDAISANNFMAENISLVNEVDKIVEVWRQLLLEKGVAIHLLPESQEPETALIKISLVDLYVIVNNFILNSVWFLEKSDQDSREITITLNTEENSTQMRMENNGPVLDEKFRAQPMRIFEIGESTKPQGTGLGLWLMRDAVERSDGQVHVIESTEGFGIEIEWNK